MPTENQQIPQRELLEKLFEASYHPILVMGIHDENKLKELAERRIKELTADMDGSLLGSELVKKLGEKAIGYLMHSKHARLFAVDFTLNRAGNCVVLADVIVSCLEHLNRQDVLKDINVKYSEDHTWLKYMNASSSFEINDMGKWCKENYPMEVLIGQNWNCKGKTFAMRGKYKEAIECFDRAFQLNPKDYRMIYNKGQAFFDSEQYKEAIECFNEALKLNLHDSDTWYYKGKALEKLGDIVKAKECLAEAERWRPFYVSPCG